MQTGVKSGRPGRGSWLAVVALSALSASCDLQRESVECDVACFGGPSDVAFSPGLTQPGKYAISATVNGKPASCSFSLPCSPTQPVCTGDITVSCNFVAGVSGVSFSGGTTGEVTVTVSRGGAELATQSFKNEPEFGLDNSCGCPGSGRVMQVQLFADLLEIGGADHGGAGRDEGAVEEQL